MLLIKFEQLCTIDRLSYHYASTQHICEFYFSRNCMQRVARHGTGLNAQLPDLFKAHPAIAQEAMACKGTMQATALPADGVLQPFS